MDSPKRSGFAVDPEAAKAWREWRCSFTDKEWDNLLEDWRNGFGDPDLATT